jgi:hypothetical protein
MLPYQDVSRKIEKRRQPFWWTPKQIEAEVTGNHERWWEPAPSELFEEVKFGEKKKLCKTLIAISKVF